MMYRLFIALLLLATPAYADYVSTVLGDNPVSFWYLDETSGTTFFDYGSSNHFGSYAGSPSLNQPGQITGHGAVQLDGSTQWANGGALGSLWMDPSSNDLSIECWMNLDTLNPDGSILFSHEAVAGGSCGGNAFYFSRLVLTASGAPAIVIFQLGCGGYMSITGSASATTGAWHYVVGTYQLSSPEVKIYLDGVLGGTSTATTGSPTGILDGGFYLGRTTQALSSPAPQSLLDGRMQMCGTYQVKLTPTQITAHYTAGLVPSGGSALPFTVQRDTMHAPRVEFVRPTLRVPAPNFVVARMNQGINRGLYSEPQTAALPQERGIR